jgi:signal transduction histidine kinase
VIIEVSDSGIGIEPEDAERIFDAFEQGGRGTDRQFGGLGLGLAIAKRLVEMHEGKISVFSEGRNRGAKFRVQLPLCSAELAEAA